MVTNQTDRTVDTRNSTLQLCVEWIPAEMILSADRREADVWRWCNAAIEQAPDGGRFCRGLWQLGWGGNGCHS